MISEDFKPRESQFFARKGFVAIKQPEFKKIETSIRGGIATIAQRSELIAVDVVMVYKLDDYVLHPGQHRVLLRGDAGLHPWAKQVYVYEGMEFVLCPESSVIGVAGQ